MQQQFAIDVAHILGQVGKWIIVLIVFGFSLTLSYMFFLAIAPPDKPWLPIAGLSLTEGGFLVWMFVFRMIKYHPIHKSIALLMTLACAACSLTVAGFEFYGMLASHFDLLTNPLVAQYVAIFLLVIFAAHFVSLIAELLVGEHQKNPFIQRGGHGQPAYQIEEQRGEPARPLASHRQSNQPKDEPANLENTAEIEPPQIEEPKPRELKPMPQSRNRQQTGLLQEGTGVLVDGVKSLFSRRKAGD
jgi:hypothetical protein